MSQDMGKISDLTSTGNTIRALDLNGYLRDEGQTRLRRQRTE